MSMKVHGVINSPLELVYMGFGLGGTTLLTQWNYLPARLTAFEMPEGEMPTRRDYSPG